MRSMGLLTLHHIDPARVADDGLTRHMRCPDIAAFRDYIG
jgi:hypothetical protein